MENRRFVLREIKIINESCKIYERYSNTPGDVAKNLFYYPEWAGRFVCKSDFYIDREKNDSLLILSTRAGKGKLIYRGEEYLLDKSNFAVLCCNERHIYFPISEEAWEFQFIHFGALGMELLYEQIYSHGGCVYEENRHISETVTECIALCREKPPAFEVPASKKLSDIIYYVLQAHSTSDNDFISPVCDYIARNYKEDLTAGKLAEIYNFSRCYFSTIFKRVTSKTLHDYILCFRLDKAKELLINTSRSVSDIAELTGFNDTGTFIRAFKKKEGVTPLKFRNERK